jgi:FixJ family two-component response regulator
LRQAPIISIVDDDESVRTGTASLVRSLGFIAYTFASASELLQSPQVHDTACVITDVQMPGISGLELQKILSDRGCSAPIIFITAFPEDRVREVALRNGAVAFLDKPFDGRVMIECLTRALERSRT